ncbi:MAG: class I SAM-dependent rRNA methyltransferase [Anaerolineae bacterium]|nr:class I SAM-dependent rRNA methyltransferase [Thermoflexales bacterium]MDW8396601.1 class I SAM-dependent rRNA methyltransferase [Anaerolineae bacterium]
MFTAVLKSGKDRAVRLRHPRLFAAAIKELHGRPRDGDVVDVLDNKGEWLARGVINQQAQIAVRLVCWDESTPVDEAFWRERIHASVERRARDPLLATTNARRLIFGESDGLPGVVVDQYADCLVIEFSTMLGLRLKDLLLSTLNELLAPRAVVLRGDDERLRNEFGGRLPRWAALALECSPPEQPVVLVQEGNLRFWVNVASGQKTGFYLDQRDNRARVARYCTGAEVLNVFAYTGAFGVYALAAGAKRVINVDASAEALELAKYNAALNFPTLDPGRWEVVCEDAFDDLRARRLDGKQYDVVILDPPKFASQPGHLDRALRAYKDLNRLGLLLVRPGGVLATFSCSGLVSTRDFQASLLGAAVEARREVHIVERLTQASDHPVLVTFPESEYLKGLICRVT